MDQSFNGEEWNFVIPLQKEDLCKEHEGQYYVKEVHDLGVALDKIKKFKSTFSKNGYESILTNFDPLYSVFCDQEIAFNQLQDVYDSVIVKLVHFLKDYVGEALTYTERQKKTEAVNVIKMVFYIFSLFVKTYEDKLMLKSENFISEPKRGKGLKPKTKQKPEEMWDWCINKKSAFVDIHSVLQADISSLWPTLVPDEQFVNMVANCCYKAFESPEIVQAKMKLLRDSIAHVLSTLVNSYNHGLTFIPKIVQLMKKHEHVASAVSSTIVLMVLEYKVTSLLPKLLKELNNTVKNEDIPGLAKTTSVLIIEIAEENPSILIPSVDILAQNLIVEPYAVRNATLIAFYEITLKCLSGDDLTEEDKSLRSELLTHLLNHMRDQNSYVRSKVLQLWSKLASEKAIPKKKLIPVLEAAKYCLRDKSSHSLKNAIHLFSVYLKGNPCTGKLNLANMRQQLVQAKVTLNAIESTKPPTRDEAWKQVEGDLVMAITNALTESNDELMEEQPATQSVGVKDVMIILTKLMQEKHFIEALNLLKMSEVQFPDANEIRCNADSSNKVEYYISALKKIFMTSPDTSASQPLNVNNIDDYNKQLVVVEYIEQSIEFAEILIDAGKIIEGVLKHSKSPLEVLEAIDFFTVAFQFGLPDAKKVVRAMLSMMNSKTPGIKEAVTSSYKSLYLITSQSTPKGKAIHIANRLIKLLKELTFNQKLALEDLIHQWMLSNELNQDLIQVLWEKYTKKCPDTSEEDRIAALVLLDLISSSQLSLVSSNIKVLVQTGLTDPSSLAIVEHTCNVLSKYALTKVDDKYLRISSDDEIIEKSVKCLTENFTKSDAKGYIPMSLSVINMIFQLCCYPEQIMDDILGDLYSQVYEPIDKSNNNDCNINEEHEELINDVSLSRLFHIFSEIMFKKLVYFETDVANALKKTASNNKPTEMAVDDEDFDAECQDNADAAAEAVFASIRELREELVMNDSSITGHLRDLVVKVCKGLEHPISPGLQSAAATALAKLMLVSQTFCESQAQLYVTLMSKSKEEAVRQNLVLGFGDIICQHPNIISPWTSHMYARLRDDSCAVRKNTIVVLHHLVAREMIKVKGQMAEVCLSLNDPDPAIIDQVKRLIIAMSIKGNTLYNIVPDIISRLSDPDRMDDISEDVFNKIMKFVLSLIGKERQNEMLIEKICHRIKETSNERQWKDLSFCLAQLSYNDRSLRKLNDLLPLLNECLYCPTAHNYISSIFTSASKSINKPELKEAAIEGQHRLDEMLTYKDGEKDSNRSSSPVRKVPPTPKSVRSTHRQIRSTRKGKK